MGLTEITVGTVHAAARTIDNYSEAPLQYVSESSLQYQYKFLFRLLQSEKCKFDWPPKIAQI